MLKVALTIDVSNTDAVDGRSRPKEPTKEKSTANLIDCEFEKK